MEMYIIVLFVLMVALFFYIKITEGIEERRVRKGYIAPKRTRGSRGCRSPRR